MKKRDILSYLNKRLDDLEKQWNFDPSNGYAQVEGADFQKVLAYGEYNALEDLYTDIRNNIFVTKE